MHLSMMVSKWILMLSPMILIFLAKDRGAALPESTFTATTAPSATIRVGPSLLPLHHPLLFTAAQNHTCS